MGDTVVVVVIVVALPFGCVGFISHGECCELLMMRGANDDEEQRFFLYDMS